MSIAHTARAMWPASTTRYDLTCKGSDNRAHGSKVGCGYLWEHLRRELMLGRWPSCDPLAGESITVLRGQQLRPGYLSRRERPLTRARERPWGSSPPFLGRSSRPCAPPSSSKSKGGPALAIVRNRSGVRQRGALGPETHPLRARPPRRHRRAHPRRPPRTWRAPPTATRRCAAPNSKRGWRESRSRSRARLARPCAERSPAPR